MKIKVPFKPRVVVALLLVAILLNAVSAVLFMLVDHVVHSDLYNYGLQFKNEWAEQYWTYSRLLMSFFLVAMVAMGISIASTSIYAQSRKSGTRHATLLLLTLVTAINIISMLLFIRINSIVNVDLYNYGLQFSYDWAVPYWTYTRLMLGSIGLAFAPTLISLTLIFSSAYAFVKIDSIKIVCITMLSVGAILLALSTNFSSTIFAFVGLSLVFWGGLLLYIRPQEYVKKSLLNETVSPLLANLDKILTEAAYKGNAVYLPPKYFKDTKTSKIYMSKEENAKLPTLEEIRKKENHFLIENPEGILMTPPGAELTKMLEEKLGKNFSDVTLEYLQQKLPGIFENIELAEDLQINMENDRVSTRITNSVFNELCRARNTSKMYIAIGCPVCSAIACALAKCSGRPVIIEETRWTEDTRIIETGYRILEE